MGIADVAMTLMTAGGLGTAIVTAVRSSSRVREERERTARLMAEQDAKRSQAIIDALSHARADLEEAKTLYEETSRAEAACQERVETLRTELEHQGRECEQRIGQVARELAQLRRSVSPSAP